VQIMAKGFFSLHGKFVFFSLLLVTTALLIYAALFSYFSYWTATALALLATIPATVLLANKVSAPALKLISALSDATDNIKDHDYSITIASDRTDELGVLVNKHNEIGQLLRAERHNINQRELLLDTVLQSTPIAMWLCDDQQRVVYSNIEARKLLWGGRRVQGASLANLTSKLNTDLAAAIMGEKEGLVSLETSGEIETYYVSCRFFSLNSRVHRLHLIRRMTREISRQEANTWKRVIRVISHELNNSLAPISSLTHSGKITLSTLASLVKGHPEEWAKLDLILTTIGERSSHLKDFIAGYAKFARLPSPRIQTFDLIELLTRMSTQQKFTLVAAQERLDVQLDQTQFEQALINLLKNARDAAGEEGLVALTVEGGSTWLGVVIADDGAGMSDEVMQQALLPFYSTKHDGTGLGLPLSREIIEGHGGQLSIRNAADAGLEVVIRVPQGKALSNS
jgi:two-component system nitrogen regulation sensor histidine kinase NtrY